MENKNIFLTFILSIVLGIIVTLLSIQDNRFCLLSIVLLIVSTILALIMFSHTKPYYTHKRGKTTNNENNNIKNMKHGYCFLMVSGTIGIVTSCIGIFPSFIYMPSLDMLLPLLILMCIIPMYLVIIHGYITFSKKS